MQTWSKTTSRVWTQIANYIRKNPFLNLRLRALCTQRARTSTTSSAAHPWRSGRTRAGCGNRYYTVLYWSVLYCICTVLYCTVYVMYFICTVYVLFCTVLYSTIIDLYGLFKQFLLPLLPGKEKSTALYCTLMKCNLLSVLLLRILSVNELLSIT